MNELSWTPAKIEKVWRIFDRALPVIADGVHVPVDELRAMLLDGKDPAIEREPRQRIHGAPKPRQTLSDEDRELALSKLSATERVLLREALGEGQWLHMTCAAMTPDRKLAWRGTKGQLRAVWRKYPATEAMVIVREVDVAVVR